MAEQRKTLAETARDEGFSSVGDAYQKVKEGYIMAQKQEKNANKSAAAAAAGPVGHWPDLHPVPTFDEAMAAMKAALARVKNESTDNVKAVHAGLTVAMFGNGQLPHDEHPPLGATAFTDGSQCDPDECCRVIEGALAMHAGAGATDAAALPWASILSVIVPLILQWFQKR